MGAKKVLCVCFSVYLARFILNHSMATGTPVPTTYNNQPRHPNPGTPRHRGLWGVASDVCSSFIVVPLASKNEKERH